MSNRFAKATAALTGLAGFALAFPVYAAPAIQLNASPSLLLPVADEETDAVWGNLRPNLTPPFSGEDQKKANVQQPKEKNANEAETKDGKKQGY